MMNLLVLMMKI